MRLGTIAAITLVHAIAVAGGCGSEPQLPGPLPAAAPYPGPPKKPRADWSELSLYDLNGKSIDTLPLNVPFKAVLRLRLAEDSPKPDSVGIYAGMMHPKHGFVIGGSAGGPAVPDRSGEIRIERELPGLHRLGTWRVRGQFGMEPFVDTEIQVRNPE